MWKIAFTMVEKRYCSFGFDYISTRKVNGMAQMFDIDISVLLIDGDVLSITDFSIYFQRQTCNCNGNCQSNSSIITLPFGCPFLQLKVIAPTNQKYGKCPQRSFLRPCLKEKLLATQSWSFAIFWGAEGEAFHGHCSHLQEVTNINQKIFGGGISRV